MPHCKKAISEQSGMAESIPLQNSDWPKPDLSEPIRKNMEIEPFSLEIELCDATGGKESINLVNIRSYDSKNFKSMNSVIQRLIEEDFIPKYSMIFKYDEEKDAYLILGLDPIPVNIPLFLTLGNMNKFKEVLRIKFMRAPEVSTGRGKKNMALKIQPPESILKKKDRSISEVINLVLNWRKMNHGYWEEDSFKKYTLEETAQNLGVPKKTLDDYMFQLKQGWIHKFDFEQKYYDRIGVLRAFVKGKKGSDEKNLKYQRLDMEFFDFFEKLKARLDDPPFNLNSIQSLENLSFANPIIKEEFFPPLEDIKCEHFPEQSYNPYDDPFNSHFDDFVQFKGINSIDSTDYCNRFQ